MKKKKVLIGIIVVIIVAIIGLAIWKGIGTDKDAYEPDGYDIQAERLEKVYHADIMVYGENPGFRDTVKYRKIDAITEETLASDESHGYQVVILFDYRGTMKITDEELLLVKKYAEEKGYDMIYIGKQYLEKLEELDFTVGCREGSYGLEYIGSRYKYKKPSPNRTGNMYVRHGIWTDEAEKDLEYNRDSLQENMIMCMEWNASELAELDKHMLEGE